MSRASDDKIVDNFGLALDAIAGAYQKKRTLLLSHGQLEALFFYFVVQQQQAERKP